MPIINSTSASATSTGISWLKILSIEATSSAKPPVVVSILSAGLEPADPKLLHGAGDNHGDGPCAYEYSYADDGEHKVFVRIFDGVGLALSQDVFKPDDDQKDGRYRQADDQQGLEDDFD